MGINFCHPEKWRAPYDARIVPKSLYENAIQVLSRRYICHCGGMLGMVGRVGPNCQRRALTQPHVLHLISKQSLTGFRWRPRI